MPSDNEIKQLMTEKVFPFFENELPELRKRIRLLEKGVDIEATLEVDPETGFAEIVSNVTNVPNIPGFSGNVANVPNVPNKKKSK